MTDTANARTDRQNTHHMSNKQMNKILPDRLIPDKLIPEQNQNQVEVIKMKPQDSTARPIQILVACDIEKTGAHLTKHPVVSVGFVVGDTSGKLLESLKVNFKVQWPLYEYNDKVINPRTDKPTWYGDFEERCWNEFWTSEQGPPRSMFMTPTPVDQVSGWSLVNKFLYNLELKYPYPYYCIRFISDNPSFDIGNIDYNLATHCDRMPMRYTTYGFYRSIVNPSDIIRGLSQKERDEITKKIAPQINHNHDSVNDAHAHYIRYIMSTTSRMK